MTTAYRRVPIAVGTVAFSALMLLAAPQLAGRAAGSQPATPLTLHYTAPDRPGPIDLALHRDGSRLVLLDAGAVVASRELTATSAISIGGPDRHDTSLTVDFSGGAIPIAIDYHPGELGPETLNLLTIRGGTFAQETHVVSGPHSGVIYLEDVPIAYANLTPVDTTVVSPVLDIMLSDDAETINVVDGPVVDGFQTTQVNSASASFESFNFANKTTVRIFCQGGADTVTLDNPNPANGLTTLVIDGGSDSDMIRVHATGAIGVSVDTAIGVPDDTVIGNGTTSAVLGTVSVDDSGGVGSLTVDDSADVTARSVVVTTAQIAGLTAVPIAINTYNITEVAISTGSGADVFTTAGPAPTYPGGLWLWGGGGNDQFTVTPVASWTQSVAGGAPAPPALPGDSLTVNILGTTSPSLAASYGATGYSGTFTFADRAPVTFSQIEGFAPTFDVGVTKTDGQATEVPGTMTTYTIVVANATALPAAGVAVADTFPAALTGVTWTSTAAGGATGYTASGSGHIADTVTLPPASSITYIATGMISPSATGSLANTASATPPPGDGNPANDSATDTDTLAPSADLRAGKTGPATAFAGADIPFTLTVANDGPSDARDVTITDVTPAGTTFVSENSGLICTTPPVGGTGTVTCTLATLAAGASSSFTLVVRAPAAPAPVVNTATVASATTPDPASGNDSANATVQVLSPSDVSGTKALTSPPGGWPRQGDPVVYTIVLANASAYPQPDNTGDEFTDTLPPQLVLSGASATSGTATTAGNTVSWNGAIPAGGSVTITVDAVVADGAAGQIVSNQGTINYDADGDGSNEATRATDDPAVAGAADPTEFQVLAPVPLASGLGLAALLLAVLLAGALLARRGAA